MQMLYKIGTHNTIPQAHKRKNELHLLLCIMVQPPPRNVE